MKDFFRLRKQLNEDQFGTFFIKFDGIKNPSKVDTAYERATDYTFGALMGDYDDIEMDGEPEWTGNVLQVYADKSEMKNINKFLSARNKLAKETQEMVKKSPNSIKNLYEKRADHFYVTALLMKSANPNTAPKYSIQKFVKESAGEFGTDKLKKKYEDETPGQLAELDAKTQMKFVAGAKAMKAYATKNGGIDKADFMKAAKMMDDIARINLLQAGPILSKLNRFVDGLDTDVRERIYVELKKVGLVEEKATYKPDPKLKNLRVSDSPSDYEKRKYAAKTAKKNEELKVSDGAAKWIADFQASDAPQFQGKSDDEKKKMAIAAFMAAKAKEGGDKKEPQNESLDEAKFSPKDIKMAIGIASDKRYAGGNMSGAVKAMDKMKPGISDHPQVRAVLKRQNEDLAEAAPKIKGPSMKGGKIMGVPGKQIGQKLDIEPQVNGMKLMFRVTTSDGSLKTVDAAGLAKMLR